MTISADHIPMKSRRARLSAGSPLLWLALAVAIACVLLSLPLSAPIGAMYWDVYIYYDAANRIYSGQVPIVDFFAPVGPLGYYLFAGALKLFPQAQPTLLAHWALLAVTAPLMALTLHDVAARSRGVALALLAPFLLYALLPFNTQEFSSFPGSDGFGIYNRQVCQLLYVLVAALLFVRDRGRLAAIVTLAMLALFLVKITGFVAGGVICAFAFAAGRVPLRLSLAILAGFLAALAALELGDHLVSSYLADIALLVSMNAGSLAPRFLQSASLNFGVLLPSAALVCLLLWFSRGELGSDLRKLTTAPRDGALTALLDRPALWLAVVLFAGILFETQNTGSQAMIFLWPAALAVLLDVRKMIARPARFVTAATLVAAMVLSPATAIIERAARAYVGALKNEQLDSSNLKTLGRVNMRKEVADRSARMPGFYASHREAYQDLIALDELPAPTLYSDFDFQIAHLKAMDEAIDAIRKLEAERGLHFGTIMSLNFTNPFPWLMDREAPRHIAIGADPFRAVPPTGSQEQEAVRGVDLALYPTCPVTTANDALHEFYADGLKDHRRIRLTDCYDAFVNPRLAGRLD